MVGRRYARGKVRLALLYRNRTAKHQHLITERKAKIKTNYLVGHASDRKIIESNPD